MSQVGNPSGEVTEVQEVQEHACQTDGMRKTLRDTFEIGSAGPVLAED